MNELLPCSIPAGWRYKSIRTPRCPMNLHAKWLFGRPSIDRFGVGDFFLRMCTFDPISCYFFLKNKISLPVTLIRSLNLHQVKWYKIWFFWKNPQSRQNASPPPFRVFGLRDQQYGAEYRCREGGGAGPEAGCNSSGIDKSDTNARRGETFHGPGVGQTHKCYTQTHRPIGRRGVGLVGLEGVGGKRRSGRQDLFPVVQMRLLI